MAVATFRWIFNRAQDTIPPGGVWSGVLGPDPRLDNASLSVAAYGFAGLVNGPQFLEVAPLTTQSGPNNERRVLVTIRNTGPRRCRHITLLLTVITP